MCGRDSAVDGVYSDCTYEIDSQTKMAHHLARQTKALPSHPYSGQELSSHDPFTILIQFTAFAALLRVSLARTDIK